MAPLPHALAAVVAVVAAQVGEPPQGASPPPGATELLAELAAEPRIVGTAGYERAVAIAERELRAAGAPVQLATIQARRAVPRRSEVLLFEDGIAASAFAGLRERWRPAAVPTMPLPAAFEWNTVDGDARGPIVEFGEGLEVDFERVRSLGVAPRGAVALVSMPRAGASRRTTVREVAIRARDAGCIAVLIAPLKPGPGPDDFALQDCAPAPDSELEDAPLVIPCAPIRSTESAAIRSRLRVKRVRGDDGAGRSLRLGPGPIEARVVVECPHEELTARTVVHSPVQGTLGVKARMHLVSLDESSEFALGGAPAIAAALRAVSIARSGPLPRASGLVFGPRHPSTADRLHDGIVLDAVLAPHAGLDSPTDAARLGPSRLAPVADETIERLSARLGDELAKRLDAAARWIAYSLGPARPDGAPERREAEPFLRILFAPLPEER